MEETIQAAVNQVLSDQGFSGENSRLEKPKLSEHGDYATAIALGIAKKTNQNPLDLARLLSEKIAAKLPDNYASVSVMAPGFINFTLTDQTLAGIVSQMISQENPIAKPSVGLSGQEAKTIVIEYSAPNIAKPMGVGHLRSTIIGQALVNIYQALGYEVITTNHLGDWGTQFGKLIVAYKKWGDEVAFHNNPIGHLLELYIRFTNEAKQDESLNDQARTAFRMLEQGDQENLTLWKRFRDLSLDELQKIYHRLGTQIEHQMGEADYRDQVEAVYQLLLKKGLVKKEGDALILDLTDQGLGSTILRRSDEGSVYITRDVAQVLWRLDHWHPDQIVYVVAQDQALHFKQLFATMNNLDVLGKTKLDHVGFGLVLLDGKRMRTREGSIIFLEDVLNEAVKKAAEVIHQKNSNLTPDQQAKTAELVGIGSVIYNDLSQNRMTNIEFNWDKMLALEGNSAPYLMYTLARANSVLTKLGTDLPQVIPPVMGDSERLVARQLIHFREALTEAAVTFSPNIIATYLYSLASSFNAFYATSQIVKSQGQEREVRIALTQAVRSTLDFGLRLLSIQPPERM